MTVNDITVVMTIIILMALIIRLSSSSSNAVLDLSIGYLSACNYDVRGKIHRYMGPTIERRFRFAGLQLLGGGSDRIKPS